MKVKDLLREAAWSVPFVHRDSVCAPAHAQPVLLKEPLFYVIQGVLAPDFKQDVNDVFCQNIRDGRAPDVGEPLDRFAWEQRCTVGEWVLCRLLRFSIMAAESPFSLNFSAILNKSCQLTVAHLHI